MSVRVMSWVWEHSRSKGMDRLVLLAIADCASDDGRNAYPSMAKLMAKTGLSDRGIQKSLPRLTELGELSVARSAGPRGCNRYRVRMTPPPNQVHPEPGSPPNNVPPNQVHPPEHSSPPPPNRVHPTPEHSSPGTVLEPSIEPSEIKTLSEKPPDRVDVEEICSYLADKIEANGSKRPTITDRWRTSARLLLDKDGRTVEQVKRCIDWCQSDEFWRANILSMPKLRDKYDQLRLAAKRSSGNGNKPYRNRTDPSAYRKETL